VASARRVSVTLCTGTAGRRAEMFSLPRDELVSGGNDLLAGKGSLRRDALRSNTGLAGINDFLQALAREAAEPFKPGGSKPVLNRPRSGELDKPRRRGARTRAEPADPRWWCACGSCKTRWLSYGKARLRVQPG